LKPSLINIRYFGVLRQIFITLLSNVFSQDIANEEQPDLEATVKLNRCQDEEGEMGELENHQESIMKMVIDCSIY
jgi:hypothetical protein